MRWLHLSHDLDIVVRDLDALKGEVDGLRDKLLSINEYANDELIRP